MQINESHELMCRCPADEALLAAAGVGLPATDLDISVTSIAVSLENDNARLRDELRTTTEYAEALKDLCIKQRKERRRLKVLLENYERNKAV